MPIIVLDEITYTLLNFNSTAIEVWEWISNVTHTLLSIWLLIQVGIEVNVRKKGPRKSWLHECMPVHVMLYYSSFQYSRPLSQIPQCIRYNTVHHFVTEMCTHAHFCYKMVQYGMWYWCIVGFVQQVCWTCLCHGRALARHFENGVLNAYGTHCRHNH